jgi:hypothetical protein
MTTGANDRRHRRIVRIQLGIVLAEALLTSGSGLALGLTEHSFWSGFIVQWELPCSSSC